MGLLALFFISIIVLYGFKSYVVKKVGVLQSWSDSYYELERKGYLFQIIMPLLAFICTAVFVQTLDGYWFQFTGFLGAASLAFVGAAARFRRGTDLESKVHYTYAYLSAISSLAMVILVGIYITKWAFVFMLLSIIGNYAEYIGHGRPEKKVWYAEWAFFDFTLFTIALLIIDKLCQA